MMRGEDYRRPTWIAWAFALVSLGGAALLLVTLGEWPWGSPRRRAEMPTTEVRRADVYSTLTARGMLSSVRNTLIEFEIERMSGSEDSLRATRYSTLTTVVPEGTYVQAGDVLCEVDASSYVEQARTQQIAVERTRSEVVRARFDRDAAELALREYLGGLRQREHSSFEMQIALSRSDLKRQEDRIEWAEGVLPMGYIAASRMDEERLELQRRQTALERAVMAYDSYKRFTEPKLIASLEAQFDRAESTYVSAKRRLDLEEEALDLYRRQIDLCTIRAPHEGYVIYCVDDDDPPIAPGVVLRRNMDLFELPDLSRLEVRAIVNQSVIRRLGVGMPARVRLDALPGTVYTGRVTHVSVLADQADRRAQETGVSNFIVRVEIDTTDRLLPGLSAEVKVLTGTYPEALVVPPSAVRVEDGTTYCYLPGPRGLERRAVDVEAGSANLLRVIDGLREGERVVLMRPLRGAEAPRGSPGPRERPPSGPMSERRVGWRR